MNPQNLTDMANSIAAFFATEPNHTEAVAGIVDHLEKFWEPRMRKQILACRITEAANLHPLAREALERMAAAHPAHAA